MFWDFHLVQQSPHSSNVPLATSCHQRPGKEKLNTSNSSSGFRIPRRALAWKLILQNYLFDLLINLPGMFVYLFVCLCTCWCRIVCLFVCLLVCLFVYLPVSGCCTAGSERMRVRAAAASSSAELESVKNHLMLDVIHQTFTILKFGYVQRRAGNSHLMSSRAEIIKIIRIIKCRPAHSCNKSLDVIYCSFINPKI